MKTQNSSTPNSTDNSQTQDPPQLTRRKMSDSEVLNMITPYYPVFGTMQFFESMVFDLLGSWCDDYEGGMWNYYKISNGAWYLSPAADGIYRVQDYAGTEFEMSPDGAGLAATLNALHRLTWHFHEVGDKVRFDPVSKHEHALRMYSYTHPDAVPIWRVLD